MRSYLAILQKEGVVITVHDKADVCFPPYVQRSRRRKSSGDETRGKNSEGGGTWKDHFVFFVCFCFLFFVCYDGFRVRAARVSVCSRVSINDCRDLYLSLVFGTLSCRLRWEVRGRRRVVMSNEAAATGLDARAGPAESADHSAVLPHGILS